jgi:diphosphate-dependent phosphofructokinase
VEFGDPTTTIDSKCADIVAQAFPHTFGQRLVRFLEPHPDTVVSGSSDAQERPPVRLGVVFSGRQSPGGHNVIWGTFDAMKARNPHSVLLGFLGERISMEQLPGFKHLHQSIQHVSRILNYSWFLSMAHS